MTCPKCGYILDPFATECPKCARGPVNVPGVAPEKPADDPEVIRAVNKVIPKAHARIAAEPPPIRYAPEHGWPLTIVLWLGLLLNILHLAAMVYAAYFTEYDIMGSGITVILGSLGLVNAFTPLLAVIAYTVLLRGHRWGFGLYMSFPAVVLAYVVSFKTPSLFDYGNAILAPLMIILVLSRWNDFE